MNRDILRRLGAGEPIEAICEQVGWTRAEFDAAWREDCARRAPAASGQAAGPFTAAATIERDRFGIPHVFAENEHDLFVAYGYAMAQDRLFQLDYLRRKGLGRLAEILGP